MQEKNITVHHNDTTKTFMLVPEMAEANCAECYFSNGGEHACGKDLCELAQGVAKYETGQDCVGGHFIYREVQPQIGTTVSGDPVKITAEMVKQVLIAYDNSLCPSIGCSGLEAVAKWIITRINNQNDPEYTEFLRLKEKFKE